MQLSPLALCAVLSATSKAYAVSSDTPNPSAGNLRGAQLQTHHRILAKGTNGITSIVHGNLGNVGVSVSKANENGVEAAAARAMGALTSDAANPLGMQGVSHIPDFVVASGRTHFTPDGSAHVRLINMIHGMEVEGAAIVMHIDNDGTISGVNGEIVTGDDVSSLFGGAQLAPAKALAVALEKAGLSNTNGEWEGTPSMAIVRTNSGGACKAWKAAYFYETKDEQGFTVPHRDMIFADVSTGYLCARHPKIYGALAMETRDCANSRNCAKYTIVSTSTQTLNTGDDAIDKAHNYALATYQFYSNHYGRDSIDGKGMKLISRVHTDRNYNNAYWDGSQMTYGDGDGSTFIPFSQDADVVAHELTHGVTERSSGLIYSGESGALNEALSDIFGAMVDMESGGATGNHIWMVGEDIYTPNTPGDALRYMNDPEKATSNKSYWPTRYTGTSDNGGVHWNSGIANLAFYLMCNGGSHPRVNNGVTVTKLRSTVADSMYRAAQVFYNSNVGCMTPSSNFAAARYCTATVHGENDESLIDIAWDAVGVPNDPPPPPPAPLNITNGVSLSGQNADTGNVQDYILSVVVPAGKSATCSTSGADGDADLYIRFDATPSPNPYNSDNDCGSFSSNSNESCTTSVTNSDRTLHALVHAYTGYSNLSVVCTINNGGGGTGCTASPSGASCSSNTECCSGNCKGKPGSKVCA